MSYPLKKRRGRPPKYLSVWQCQHDSPTLKAINHNNNNDDDDNENNNDARDHVRNSSKDSMADRRDPCPYDVTGSVDDVDGRNEGSLAASGKEIGNSHGEFDNQPSVTDSDRGQKWAPSTSGLNCDDVGRGEDRPAEVTANKPTEPTPAVQSTAVRVSSPPVPAASCAGSGTACVRGNREGLQASGAPIPVVVQESWENADRKDHPGSVLLPPGGGHVLPGQPEPRQPIRRRPGRPPGSTKKVRASFPAPVRTIYSDDDFSLRRFFEAGGRDYKDYLEWLKTRRQSELMTSRPVHAVPSAFFPPHCPSSAGGVMTSQQPGRFAVPGPSVVRRALGQPEVTQMTSASSHSCAQPQAAALDYKCFTFKVPGVVTGIPANPTTTTTSPPPPLPPTPPTPDACALDLSSKRMRRGSDSEKENSYLASKRLKHERPEDVTRKHNALVESSTGRDVTVTWSVDQVADFVSKIPECGAYAEVFRSQRIDGTTLPHLSDDHLLNHVGMKLGHMIHLRLALNRLRSEK